MIRFVVKKTPKGLFSKFYLTPSVVVGGKILKRYRLIFITAKWLVYEIYFSVGGLGSD